APAPPARPAAPPGARETMPAPRPKRSAASWQPRTRPGERGLEPYRRLGAPRHRKDHRQRPAGCGVVAAMVEQVESLDAQLDGDIAGGQRITRAKRQERHARDLDIAHGVAPADALEVEIAID